MSHNVVFVIKPKVSGKPNRLTMIYHGVGNRSLFVYCNSFPIFYVLDPHR